MPDQPARQVVLVSVYDGTEVVLDPLQAVIAISRQTIYNCGHCTPERDDRAIVFHLIGEGSDAQWGKSVEAIQALH